MSDGLARGMLADMARILFLRKLGVHLWLPMLALCVVLPVAADGVSKLEEALNQKDYLSALRIGEELASSGNARAQYILGTMYLQGNGVPKDLSVGVTWLEKSAQQNNTDALGLLSLLHYWGAAPNSDRVKAWVYAYMALELGSDDALELEARALADLSKEEINEGVAEIEAWAKISGIHLPWTKK